MSDLDHARQAAEKALKALMFTVMSERSIQQCP
jgi:hypothetical protein